MSQVPPSTIIEEPIPAIVRRGRPVKTQTPTILIPPMPEDLPKGIWSEQATKVLKERYLIRDNNGEVTETEDQMCWRVAWDIAYAEANYGGTYEQIMAMAREYYRLMVTHEFLPNSPTLMNAGKNNGLQYSACYVIPVDDSIEGIFDGIKWQAIVHKSGGGTGFSFSRLRGSNARVGSTKGVASGPVSFMKIYDAATEQIKQGGMRRGANMGILRVDHPDVMSFIHCKDNGGINNFNISVAITDAFIKAYRAGTSYDLIDPKNNSVVGQLDAHKVMDEIADGAWKTGDPGLIFIDQINSSCANPVPTLGPIEATNPCVTGDSLISTEKGLVRMKDLVDKNEKIKLVIDERASGGKTEGEAIKFFDNGIKDVVKVVTKSGLELTVTLDHKLLTADGWKETQKLKVGDSIFIQSKEGKFNQKNGKWSKELGQILGWLVGDGWVRTGDKDCRVGFTFGKEDLEILNYLKPHINKLYGKEIKEIERVRNTYHLSYHGKSFVDFFIDLGVKAVKADEKVVPESIFTAPRESVIGFLQGLFTADGTVNFRLGFSSYVRLTSKSKTLLNGVQLLLLNLGIVSKIYDRSRKPRVGMFPYVNKKGEEKSYTLDGVLYELEISKKSVLKFFSEVGFMGGRHKEKIAKFGTKNFREDKYVDKILEIIPVGKERVYDLTEQLSYTFIANGIVSYDCGEQPLYPFDACNLGSIFLTYFVENKQVNWNKLEKTVKTAVRFLDSVIERNPFPLPQIKDTVTNIRRIGLGVGGWADLLAKLEIPYNSNEALELAEKLMKFVNDKGHEASQELAKERGAFPLFPESIFKDDKPMRNSTVTTIAPTGTIGIIANASTGVEPFFAIAYKHYVKTNAIERTLLFFNPLFEEYAKNQSWYTDEVKEKIASEGTLAHIQEIPDHVKKVFATAHDIEPIWHVKMQAAFQKNTDNAVSKTINMPNSATREDILKAYIEAYETGCRGITVYRDGCKDVQVLNLGTKDKKEPLATNGHANGHAQPVAELRGRPQKLTGNTYRVSTPVGHAFITINSNEDNQPFEIFINVGHAGTDIAADAEAIGRLISMSLRIPSQLSPKEISMQVVEQLRGIGGSNHIGFGVNKVKSLADAIAKILSEHMMQDKETTAPEAFQAALPLAAKRDLCPSCGAAAFIFEEGCSKCLACSYSKC